jgi:hypothetical protein
MPSSKEKDVNDLIREGQRIEKIAVSELPVNPCDEPFTGGLAKT